MNLLVWLIALPIVLVLISQLAFFVVGMTAFIKVLASRITQQRSNSLKNLSPAS
jgi:uncharacterized integral membrane protein